MRGGYDPHLTDPTALLMCARQDGAAGDLFGAAGWCVGA